MEEHCLPQSCLQDLLSPLEFHDHERWHAGAQLGVSWWSVQDTPNSFTPKKGEESTGRAPWRIFSTSKCEQTVVLLTTCGEHWEVVSRMQHLRSKLRPPHPEPGPDVQAYHQCTVQEKHYWCYRTLSGEPEREVRYLLISTNYFTNWLEAMPWLSRNHQWGLTLLGQTSSAASGSWGNCNDQGQNIKSWLLHKCYRIWESVRHAPPPIHPVRWHGGTLCEASRGAPEEGCFGTSERLGWEATFSC